MDETLNPRLGGYLSMLHDADSFEPPLPSLSPIVVSAIRVAAVIVAVLVGDLPGDARARNRVAKNTTRPQFTRRNRDWVFFKTDWCNYV